MAIKQLKPKAENTASQLRQFVTASGITGKDLDQPIPGIDKHDPSNQKFVENLVITRETNPLLYKKLMSWD